MKKPRIELHCPACAASAVHHSFEPDEALAFLDKWLLWHVREHHAGLLKLAVDRADSRIESQ
jgi:hypothetical protein